MMLAEMMKLEEMTGVASEMAEDTELEVDIRVVDMMAGAEKLFVRDQEDDMEVQAMGGKDNAVFVLGSTTPTSVRGWRTTRWKGISGT